MIKKLVLFHLFLTRPGNVDPSFRDEFPWKEFGYLSYKQLAWRTESYSASSLRGAVAWHLKHGNITQVQRNGTLFMRLSSSGREVLLTELSCLNTQERWDGRWRIVIFTGDQQSELKGDSYRLLRESLSEAGFRPLERAVYLSPYPISEQMRSSFAKKGLLRCISALETRNFLIGDETQFISQAWNLEEKTKQYTEISREYDKLLTYFRSSKRLIGGKKLHFLEILSSHFTLLAHETRVPDQFFLEGNIWKNSILQLQQVITQISA